jgi:hypothetical protein
MNQELLATTITFFKEQGGTYEAMHSQMLAGGIKEEEIQQLYQEIVRLGLDPHAHAQVAQTQVAQSPTPQVIAPIAQTSAVTPTPAAQPPVAQASIVQLSATPGAVSVASLSPFLANTAQGETFGVPVAPLPTPGTPSPVVTATKSIVPAIIAILIFIGLGFGGTFAYAYLNPYTAFGTSIAQMLSQVGLPGVIPTQPPTQEVPLEATTTPSLTEASSTLQTASTTEATSTETLTEGTSTQATTTSSIATSTEQVPVIQNATNTEVATSTKK